MTRRCAVRAQRPGLVRRNPAARAPPQRTDPGGQGKRPAAPGDQRSIGRARRTVTNLKARERQIKIDCDVLQADAAPPFRHHRLYVALYLCFAHEEAGAVNETRSRPCRRDSCASPESPRCSISTTRGSTAGDANFVLTAKGGIIEVQGTAERAPFSEAEFLQLLAHARKGIGELTRLQRIVLGLE